MPPGNSTSSPPIAPQRRRLPNDRAALTHRFCVGGHKGYLTVGLYEDGHPGEVFIKMAKEGSTLSGLMDSFAIVVSLALQHGVPLHVLCSKLAHMRFEPSGFTGDGRIGYAKSIVDYIFRWLALKFPASDEPGRSEPNPPTEPAQTKASEAALVQHPSDAPACLECGAVMVRSGACYKCANCGATSGCS